MAGYWIVLATEKDEEALAEYRRLWKPVGDRYEARIIAGYGRAEFREGEPHQRAFIAQFPSYEQAVACYEDPDYQTALSHADRGYDRSLVIVEGD